MGKHLKKNLLNEKCKKICVATVVSATLFSSGISTTEAKTSINNIPIDKVAHAGISYIITDQLQRNVGMNRFWASFTTIGIGAIREFTHRGWDGKDFVADVAGVALYQLSGKF